MGFEYIAKLSVVKTQAKKFAKNNALNGTKFIGNSSPLASVGALYNFRRG